MQDALASFGFSSFVAHEDIAPDSEWQAEIEKALQTCDCLVALLHQGFSESTWTDQEIGYALGRGIPVLSVRIDMAPYGLFGKKQAFNGKGKAQSDVAQELFEALCSNPKTEAAAAHSILDVFCESSSFASSKVNLSRLEKISFWGDDFKKVLRAALAVNTQIMNSWGVKDGVEKLIEKNDPDTQTKVPDLSNEIPF